MQNYEWYSTLIKPEWAPSASVFGPVWSVLYVIIAITFFTVFYRAAKGTLPRKIALPFALNLVFNFAFTPLQFGLQDNFLAALDILLVLATLIWSLLAIYPRAKWITLANVPYFLWVLFATILQFTITWL